MYTVQQQADPNHQPTPGEVIQGAGCTCWIVGPRGKGNSVYKYNRRCDMHGDNGFARGKVWLER